MNMAITVTTDVFCDECGRWTNGASGTQKRSRPARRAAKAKGWIRVKHGDALADLCPACAMEFGYEFDRAKINDDEDPDLLMIKIHGRR